MCRVSKLDTTIWSSPDDRNLQKLAIFRSSGDDQITISSLETRSIDNYYFFKVNKLFFNVTKLATYPLKTTSSNQLYSNLISQTTTRKTRPLRITIPSKPLTVNIKIIPQSIRFIIRRTCPITTEVSEIIKTFVSRIRATK